MKKLLILPCLMFALATIFLGCDGDGKSRCDVPDPANQIPWLRDTITDLKGTEQDVAIYMGDYKGQKVFLFNLCCPTCKFFAVPNIYTCMGTKIENADLSVYYSTMIVYHKEDSECISIGH
jgi:hypothetical protein